MEYSEKIKSEYMQPTTIYFVRHGETEYNRRRIMQGRRINSSLNATGRRQAYALAERLADLEFDAVYTSALDRAIQTAEIVTKGRHITIERLRGLDEMSWGVFEGEPWSESLRKMLDEMYSRWDRGEFDVRVEAGESILDVQQRGLEAVDCILERHPGETVLVVTHGRLLRVLLSTILGDGLERMNEFDHANTGVNVVTFKKGQFSSSLLNCTAHLGSSDSILVE